MPTIRSMARHEWVVHRGQERELVRCDYGVDSNVRQGINRRLTVSHISPVLMPTSTYAILSKSLRASSTRVMQQASPPSTSPSLMGIRQSCVKPWNGPPIASAAFSRNPERDAQPQALGAQRRPRLKAVCWLTEFCRDKSEYRSLFKHYKRGQYQR